MKKKTSSFQNYHKNVIYTFSRTLDLFPKWNKTIIFIRLSIFKALNANRYHLSKTRTFFRQISESSMFFNDAKNVFYKLHLKEEISRPLSRTFSRCITFWHNWILFWIFPQKESGIFFIGFKSYFHYYFCFLWIYKIEKLFVFYNCFKKNEYI